MFYLNEDVFVVSGPVRHAVYNLATGKLYSITDQSLDVLKRLKAADEAGQSPELSEGEAPVRRFLEMELIYPPAAPHKPAPCEAPKGKPALGINFAWLEVCDRCNLKCLHCYEEANDGASGRMMAWEDYLHVIAQLKAGGIKKIQFIGGEPMMHPRLKDMIILARPDFEFIEVFTNATMINGEWALFFKEHNIHVAASVYSYDAAEHDKVTGVSGAHALTARGLALLKEKAVPFRTATVCMDGVRVGEKQGDLFSLEGKQDPVRLVGRASLTLLNKDLIARKIITRAGWFSRPLHKGSVRGAMKRHNCFGTKLYIAADLEVYPCVMERRFSHGNLVGHTLKGLLQEDILEMTKDRIEGCRDCEYRYACFDCRPDSMSRGRFDKPWYCAYDPTTGLWDDSLTDKLLTQKEEMLFAIQGG
ncbi:MAG: radical SAM protein [Eubacteriales bacterium]|nr:radical SAM protein [Eubacteriales bacterium]